MGLGAEPPETELVFKFFQGKSINHNLGKISKVFDNVNENLANFKKV